MKKRVALVLIAASIVVSFKCQNRIENPKNVNPKFKQARALKNVLDELFTEAMDELDFRLRHSKGTREILQSSMQRLDCPSLLSTLLPVLAALRRPKVVSVTSSTPFLAPSKMKKLHCTSLWMIILIVNIIMFLCFNSNNFVLICLKLME